MADPAPTPARSSGPRVTLAAHDRKQLALEIRHAPGSAITAGSHDVELFLFIPRNVGLTAANYPGAQFYHDLTAYLRLDLPDLGLADLCASPRSPLHRLDAHLAELARGEATADPIGVAVKLFGHEFTEAVHRARARLSSAIQAEGWPRELATRVRALAAASRAALERLREARHRFAPFRRVAPDVWAVFQQTDEYASLFLDEALATLAHELGARQQRIEPGEIGSGDPAGVIDVLATCAAAEARYRHAQGFVNLDHSSDVSREYFLYRRSLLKKAVHQALWVRTRRRQVDSYLRNAAGMVAAGMAATWALIAQVPAQFLALSPVTQTVMFVLPVIGYVLKDRIKELTKEWMIRRMRAYDQETELVGSQLARSGLGSLCGTLREQVQFLDHVPDDVLAIRQRGRSIAGARIGGEVVLAYRRKLEILAPRDGQLRATDELALRQIIRLNLRHFMTRLDDRDQIVRHYDPAIGGFATHEIAKVYHLNAVVRIGGPDPRVRLERWRVVFSRDGIERIEHPA
ncbi:MAG TPA: hypothetical protein VHT91_49155 [Kofleriaceae bacterium]|jgi:hypothetical protein|nr:hypothetical protein [Kofleriaceae bacterium]